MKIIHIPTFICAALAAIIQPCPAQADTFGSGANTFTIDFVNIGNAGNADDFPVGPGARHGGVPYRYRMAVTEVPQNWITKATALGLTNIAAGPWNGSQPATLISWYEAAAFVNWLNTSTGHQAAYKLTFDASSGNWSMLSWSSAEAWQAGGENLFRHKDAYFFLPSRDEWYKSAYHKNDGVTANYWTYATGSDSIPLTAASGTAVGTAVYNSAALFPAAVNNNGGLSAYRTRGQGGNVSEFLEQYGDNNLLAERPYCGGYYDSHQDRLSKSLFAVDRADPRFEYDFIGFRVASVDVDTDGDGIPDVYETGTGVYVSPQNTGTSPTNPDTDSDGLNDGQEVNTYNSNPHIKDTDGDGFEDGFEVLTGFSPTSAASTPDAASSIRTAAEYRFNAANGISYRIEASTDFTNWSTIETNIVGTGGVITRFYSIEGQPRSFFRSRRN